MARDNVIDKIMNRPKSVNTTIKSVVIINVSFMQQGSGNCIFYGTAYYPNTILKDCANKYIDWNSK